MQFLVVLFTLAAYTKAKPLVGYALAPISPPYLAPAPYPYPAAAVVAAPPGAKSQYYAQDYTGRVSYAFADPTQTQSVIQDAAGNKVGSFSFINGEGKLVQANYIADSLGYQLTSNDLPSATQEQSKPVQDMTEVEARAKYFADYEQAKNHDQHVASPEQTQSGTNKLSNAPPNVAPISLAYAPPVVPIPYAPHVPITYPAPYPPFGYPVHYPYPIFVSSQ